MALDIELQFQQEEMVEKLRLAANSNFDQCDVCVSQFLEMTIKFCEKAGVRKSWSGQLATPSL